MYKCIPVVGVRHAHPAHPPSTSERAHLRLAPHRLNKCCVSRSLSLLPRRLSPFLRPSQPSCSREFPSLLLHSTRARASTQRRAVSRTQKPDCRTPGEICQFPANNRYLALCPLFTFALSSLRVHGAAGQNDGDGGGGKTSGVAGEATGREEDDGRRGRNIQRCDRIDNVTRSWILFRSCSSMAATIEKKNGERDERRGKLLILFT